MSVSNGSRDNLICDNTVKKSAQFDLYDQTDPGDNTCLRNRFSSVGP